MSKGLRYLCLAGVSAIMLFEHLQLMSYIKKATKPDADDWNSSARSAFDGLKSIALRFTGDSFFAIYIISCIVSFLTFAIYIAFSKKIHEANKSESPLRYLIWFVEYIIYGIGFVPMIGALAEVQYCNSHDIDSYHSVSCWGKKQMALIEVGFVFSSFAFFISAVVLPALKSERNGVEKRWGDECYFFGFDRILLVGIIYLLAPIRLPWVGILLTCVLIAYIVIFECYNELHIASLKVGLLCGQAWLFLCADEADNNGNTASDLMAGWIPAILIGYSLLWIKSLVFKRKYKGIPLQK
ncbi:unnamed protein product [Blepharisma stoltei]|uniref:Uncharacterized protein n=1 Tax=Blepharisma stoltei TaxID=1481888 RepID=A0AAU9JDW4_9CILI|nr:unnamed protein product [Blepharisma stoltei]